MFDSKDISVTDHEHYSNSWEGYYSIVAMNGYRLNSHLSSMATVVCKIRSIKVLYDKFNLILTLKEQFTHRHKNNGGKKCSCLG